MARVVPRRESRLPGHRPDLQEMHRVGTVLVHFRMGDACAARGELHVAAVHAVKLIGGDIAAFCALAEHGVTVGELARENVGEDLKVAVRVGGEPGLGLDAVFVEDAEGAEVGEAGIVPWVMC